MSARADVAREPAVPRAVAVVSRAVGEICGGAVLEVLKDGQAMYTGAFGEQVPHGDPVTVDSVFDFASITKLFTTTALKAL